MKRAVHRRAWLHAAWALPVQLAVSGCGFALRQPPRLQFQSIALTGFSARSPLAATLREQLGRQVRVLDTPAGAQVVLHALKEGRERGVVATTAAAQVRELQLRQRLQLQARNPQGRELMPAVDLLLTRDLSYSETAALGKMQEEDQLYREMEADVVQQVLRRLAAIRL